MAALKSTVNTLLRRTTGYQLTRAEADAESRPAPGPGAGKPQRSRRERRLARELAELREATKNHPAARMLEQDAEARDIMRRVDDRTMTGHEKVHGLVIACRYLARHRVPGAIVECGVWRGGSMQAAALTLLEAGESDRELHLFDTFEGMPPPGEHDRQIRNGAAAADLLAQHSREHRVWAIADLEDVQKGMAEVPYPQDLVHFHKGLVEETVPDQAPDRIALLRLDTDWYESTRHELEHLYPRLVPGGVLIIDDYGHWEGARKAVDEYFEALPDPVLLLPLGPGRIAVKPG
jgi:hypothetical protein